MSGKLAPIDLFITVGSFILVLGLYKMVRPVLFRSYASTKTVSDELADEDKFTIAQCSQTESHSCCRAGAQNGFVSADTMANCHLCHHPSCVDVEARQDDPGISLPFKKNIVNVIRPKGANEIYDYVNNYARAYAGRVTYV